MKRLLKILCIMAATVCRAQIVSNGVYPLVAGGQTIGLITVAVPQLPAVIFTNTFTNTVTQIVTNNTGGYPLGPTNLLAFGVTDKSAVLGWQNRSTVLSIQVLRNGCIVATLASNATTYLDSGLTPSTAYLYQLQAGFADSSTTVITSNAVPAGVQAPVGLTAVSTAAGNLVLNWYSPGQQVGFGIRTNLGSAWQLTGGFKVIGVASNQFTSTITGLPSGKLVAAQVSAYATNATGGWINEMTGASAAGVVK